MQKELQIVKEIRQNGLIPTIQKYKLNYKDAGHKFLLKYDQIESSSFKTIESVRESRGVIILKNNLEVISYPFRRFFNHDEPHADKIDYSKSRILKKEDGSLMVLYFDPILNDWCVQTSGTPDAETSVGDNNISFKTLFHQTAKKYPLNYDNLIKGYCYCFELCTPLNVVVTQHTEYKLVLLNVRNLTTMDELDYSDLLEISIQLNIPLVESYDMSNIIDIQRSLIELPYDDEGYIAWDGFNRVKIKNPKYVIAHRFKSSFSDKNLFGIIGIGEQDEILATMPQVKDKLTEINEFCSLLQTSLQGFKIKCLEFIDNSAKSGNYKEDKKQFALFVKANLDDIVSPFSGYFFNLFDGKDFDVRDIIFQKSESDLFDYFKKYKNKKQNDNTI